MEGFWAGNPYLPENARKEFFVYPSRLQNWLDCQHLLELISVLRKPAVYGPYIVPGSCVEEGTNANLVAMRDTGAPLDRERYLGLIDAKWNAMTSATDYNWSAERLNPDEVRRKIDEAALLHYNQVAPDLDPLYVQEKLTVDISTPALPNVFTGGFLDYGQRNGWLHDLKLSGKRKQDRWLPTLQATLYTIAAQHGSPRVDVRGFQVDYLVWGEGDHVYHDPRPIVVTQQMINFAIDDARRFAASVRAGIFARSGYSHWKCKPNSCDQWDNCRGLESPTQIQIPTN